MFLAKKLSLGRFGTTYQTSLRSGDQTEIVAVKTIDKGYPFTIHTNDGFLKVSV